MPNSDGNSEKGDCDEILVIFVILHVKLRFGRLRLDIDLQVRDRTIEPDFKDHLSGTADKYPDSEEQGDDEPKVFEIRHRRYSG